MVYRKYNKICKEGFKYKRECVSSSREQTQLAAFAFVRVINSLGKFTKNDIAACDFEFP